MTEYLAVLDHRGNPIKIVSPNDIKKDWSDQWKKGLEANFLNVGGNVTSPMAQSYVINRCVNLIADTAPKAPLEFYRGMEKVEPNHQIVNLFRRPGKTTSYFELISKTAMFYALYGEAFFYMNQSIGQSQGTSNIPAELIVIDPRSMKEVIDPQTKMLKGWLFNNKISITVDEVIHLKSNNPYNVYRGLSVLDSIKFEMNTDYKAGQFQERFFEAGAVPGFVLTTDKEDNTPEKELRKYSNMWDANHKGVSKSHKTAILRGGMDFKVVGLTQKEMSFIESRIMTRDIILETFGVPKAVFGATENVNRATAEVQERVFWETTIQPFLLRLQAKINADLVWNVDQSITAKFNFTKIPVLQNLYAEEVESVWKLAQVGYSRNELNERFDLGFPVDIETGDDKYMMMNLINVNEDVRFEPTTDVKMIEGVEVKQIEYTDKDARQRRTAKKFMRIHTRLERAFKKKLYNYFEMQKRAVLRNLTKSVKAENYNEIYSSVSGMWDRENKELVLATTPIMKETIEQGQLLALENIGIDREVILNEGLLLKRMNKITGINDTVWNQIKMNIHEGVQAGETIDDIAGRIKNVYSMAKTRSLTIARTEVTAGMNEASLIEYKENGVSRVEWLSAGDSNVRPEHQANADVGPLPIGSTFPSGETYPSAVNCRCTLAPVII